MSVVRLSRLQGKIEENKLAAVAINAGPTLTYLTGLDFHLMERPVVMIFSAGADPTIILPELEIVKLDGLHFSAKVFTYGEDLLQWPKIFQQALSGIDCQGRKIGVEPRQLRLLEYEYLRNGCQGGEFVDGSAIIAALRAKKDDGEIENMRKAVRIAEEALSATLGGVKIGVTEKEIASELFLQLLRAGTGLSLPFTPIVSSGPNGANPHATPSARSLVAGDLLIVDWGASFNGYAADLTRTFAVGEIDQEWTKIHGIVHQANRAGRLAGRPGVSCAEVDMATRQVIEEAGYGRYFTHRTGHGIGMECHEDPYIRAGNNQLLEAGMAYTVEPGIYLTGRNGVRIEDDVVVTATGAESLSTMPRAIRVVG